MFDSSRLQNCATQKRIKTVLLSLAASLCIELFVCNVRFFESRTYTPLSSLLTESHIPLGAAEPLLLFSGDEDIRNIYINAYCIDEAGKKQRNIALRFFATDEGNALSYYLNTANISTVRRSHYLRLNVSGRLHTLSVQPVIPKKEHYTAFVIETCSFNVPVPLFFSVIRFFLLFCVIIFLYAFRSGSPLWNIRFDEHNRFQKKLNVVFVCMVALFCLALPLAKGIRAPETDSDFHLLAERFTQGKVTLPFPVDDRLLAMENPYDTGMRRQIFGDNEDHGYAWDAAFYKGKYYCYFGVVPTAVLFYPFFLITGHHLPLQFAIALFGFLFLLSLFLLLKKIVSLYFGTISYVAFLFLYVLSVLCSGILHAFFGNYYYSLPILAGIACALTGLYFWFSASDKAQRKRMRYVALGSLFIALTAGCRPQLVLVAFLFPLVFKDMLVIDGRNGKKVNIRFFVALMIPVLPVAVALMAYNYTRFGSVFDFGATYNLTTNDMTHRGWKWDRSLLGLYTFLFEPVTLRAVFPFLYASEVKTLFLGTTIREDNFGGIFSCFPILFLACIPFFQKRYVEKSMRPLLLFFIIAALIIVLVDTQVAGIVGSRYRMDFGWLLSLSLGLFLCSMLKKITEPHKTFAYMLLKYSLIAAVLYNMCVYFALARTADLFRGLMQFWV